MDERLFARLDSHVRQGRLILFTGAGFSLAASNAEGQRLPTVSDLTHELWSVAFPGEPYEESLLQDVYEAALLQAKRATVDLLRSRLTVDPGSLPAFYRTWFSLPWHRIYTVNVDDLAEAANRAFDLPRRLEPLSALTGAMPASSEHLPVVHLNGLLDDLPDVTFAGRQYGERLASPDIWYANVARELIGHPFLFVGTSLDEPPLWQYVEARGTKSAGGRELRPGSYLVTPQLARARAVALRQYQIDLIEATAESFEAEVLRRLDEASEKGFAARRRAAAPERDVLVELAALADDSADDEREFLLGREPRWSDITRGFAIERDFDRELLERVDADRPNLVIVTGTAGAGKSASAMRLALALDARGERVVVLNHDADLRSYRIRHALEASPATVLFVDDLDRLGGSARGVLDDVKEFRPDVIVIAALRSARYDGMGLGEYVAGMERGVEAVAPPLSDPDIDGLLDALDKANRLGVLKNQPRAAQRAVMAEKSGRQLLVAMIEATSGIRFDQKIESECRELAPEAALVYGVVALATNFRIGLADAELLAAVGGDPAVQIRHVDSLLRTHLLVRDRNGNVALRHRLVAERAVEFFRSARLVEPALRGLVFALATAARPGHLRDTPKGRAVIRLINHRLLIEFLQLPGGAGADSVAIRGVYEEVEGLLTQDHHFWLQRGSFETEQGDVNLAKNFIEQARSLAPDDPYVRTQWAYMTLKRAWRQPNDPDAASQVEEAFGELDDVIASRGRRDAYPFHVYGSQGLAWANRAPLSEDQRRLLLQQLRAVVEEGVRLHRGARDLAQLARDLEAAYLRLAVT